MITASIRRFLPFDRRTPGRVARAVLDAILSWQDRANQRHRLRAMSDFMLKDIGLSRADVDREASKPFWNEIAVAPISKTE